MIRKAWLAVPLALIFAAPAEAHRPPLLESYREADRVAGKYCRSIFPTTTRAPDYTKCEAWGIFEGQTERQAYDHHWRHNGFVRNAQGKIQLIRVKVAYGEHGGSRVTGFYG